MSNLKNWAIKKLGGYTAKEYKAVTLAPAPPNISSFHGRPQKVCAQIFLPPEPSDFVLHFAKNDIANSIFRHIEPLITYETSTDCFTVKGETRMTGTLWVVMKEYADVGI